MENGGLCVILDLIVMQLLLCASNLDIVLVLPPLGPPGEYSNASLVLMGSPDMCTSCVFTYYSVTAVLLVLCG